MTNANLKQLKNNFGFINKCGVLAPVFSLPTNYLVGSFGKPCFEFVDFLKEANQTCWQVLPLNPTSYGDSPYQAVSTFAGNPYFIDLEVLYSKGLITKKQLLENKKIAKFVDYSELFNSRYNLLRKAFSKFNKTEDYKNFIKKNSKWLNPYALFMAIKVKNNYAPWWDWSDNFKYYKNALKYKSQLKKEIDFWKFIQFEFFSEWNEVKKYANSKNIKIIGDLPIYVAYDSVDVWQNTDMFLLDKNLTPKLVAGVPPDAFSSDGQLWGNPIYDWEYLKKNDFSWWVDRVNQNKKLYDLIRIDHFRGFVGYYVVPYGDSTARNGYWVKGVADELFDAINKRCKGVKIIAEDLGVITDDVKAVLQKTGFPGMKVLQFAFYEDNSLYLPKNFDTKNCIAYTGTHDSDTTKSWLETLNESELNRIFDATKVKTKNIDVYTIIKLALSSSANLVIIPLQDYLNLGGEARINMPSKAQGNWTYIFDKSYKNKKNIEKIKNLTQNHKR